MTFFLSGFLVASVAAAAAVVALHFLSFQRPRPHPLPTARFIPDRPLRAVASFRRPTDLLVLLLRALALLLLGAAFARPVQSAARGSVRRIFLVDHSRAVADASEAADSVRRLASPADAVVGFDSVATPALLVGDAVPAVAPETAARGSLSAALAAAGRAARLVRAHADSVELVLVSPLAREELDEATLLLRRAWPGRIRIVAVRPAAGAVGGNSGGVELSGETAGDPLVATRELLRADDPRDPATVDARVVRGVPSGDDSTWVRGAPARRLVVWPADGVPRGWTRAPLDTVGAVIAGRELVVAPFARTVPPAIHGAAVIARWVDGSAAAVERPLGAGCVREVGIGVAAVGDLAIAPSFASLMRAITGPCGGPRDLRPLDDATRRELAGAGALARATIVGGPASDDSPLAKWFLIGAATLLLVEIVARSRPADRVA